MNRRRDMPVWWLPGRAGLLFAILSCVCLTVHDARAAEVSFRNDVMAVLSKAGCNMGTCHGNRSGKGGFKLSLRGEDPAHDFEVLTRESSSRRVNPLDSDRSLLLLKPLMQVSHEGGRRLIRESREHRILRDWVAAGLPADSEQEPRLAQLVVAPTDVVLRDPSDEVQLTALARFADGTERDVTALAVYEAADPVVAIEREGLVRRLSLGETTVLVRYLNRQVAVRVAFIPDRSDDEWQGPDPANRIDALIFAKLRRLTIQPSEVCGDAVFLRRACLDLLGVLPTAEEVQAFVQSAEEGKRAALVDALLDRPEFAEHWALKWSDLLRNEEKVLDRKGVQGFHDWLRRSIAENQPVDEFVKTLIASRGSTYVEPPANFWRALREPLVRAESTAQLFLGVRLQCARCHNHPFDQWTQDDYYSWANVFSQVDYKIVDNRRRDDNDQHEFDGEQIVFMQGRGEFPDPRTGVSRPPRFLGEESSGDPEGQDRLRRLADWLTRPDNERFARMQVNRIWYHLLGRGLVDPIDDFRATNPSGHPQLLDELAAEFVASGFDRQHMIRLIMASRTYQMSSEPNETNATDERNFSRGGVRRLSAEELLDALTQVIGVPVEFNGYPLGLRAGQIPGVCAIRPRDEPPAAGDAFLTQFGKPPRLQSCECERSDATTLSQAFEFTSGPLIADLLSARGSHLDQWLASAADTREVIRVLFWTALSRPPNAAEELALSAHIDQAADRRAALEDVVWSVVSSNEFLLRH